jgi:hypothetical protein
VGGESTLAKAPPVREEASGRLTVPARAAPADADEPGTADAARGADSLALAIPFAPVSTDPPHQDSRDREHADQDDPDAPLIVAKRDVPREALPVLNNGRDGMLLPPSKSPAANGAERTDTKIRSDSPAAVGQEMADTDQGDSPPHGPPAPESAAPGPAKSGSPQLAAQYAPLDHDGDGQIGLYEWPRDKLAEFQRLDGDRNGFLAPGELGE